ncbi:hypothetical protein Ancab_005796 [Ancistrocladus abbreviatus]
MEARKERDAQPTYWGWTVIVLRNGGKRTSDFESGVAVSSIAQAAVLDKMAEKKNKDVRLDFYRFQRREAQRSGPLGALGVLLPDSWECLEPPTIPPPGVPFN